MRVNVAGLPDGGAGVIDVEGDAARFVVARDTVITRVPPGTYRVVPRPVLVDGQSYSDTTSRQVVVVADQFAVAQVEYRLCPTTVRVILCHRTPKCGHDGTLQNRPRRRWGSMRRAAEGAQA